MAEYSDDSDDSDDDNITEDTLAIYTFKAVSLYFSLDGEDGRICTDKIGNIVHNTVKGHSINSSFDPDHNIFTYIDNYDCKKNLIKKDPQFVTYEEFCDYIVNTNSVQNFYKTESPDVRIVESPL